MVRYQSTGLNRLSGGTFMGFNLPFSGPDSLPSIHKAAKQDRNVQGDLKDAVLTLHLYVFMLVSIAFKLVHIIILLN